MIASIRDVGPQLVYRCRCDGSVRICEVDHRPIVDTCEVTVLLSKAQRVRVRNATAEVLSVLAVRRCRELHDFLASEELRNGTPGTGGNVVCLVDEQAIAA